LRTVALEGPGVLSGRLALLEVLTDRDLLPANSSIVVPGWPHREAPIRLSTNPDDRPAPTGEAMTMYSQAVALTHQQKFEQARRLYTRLFQDLPENFMIEFNLAGCEYHQAHLRERGIERIKKVHLEHPNYLQARGSLAGIYREQGDLRTASELLVWPEVDVAGEQDYAQMTAMLGLVWLDQDHDMTEVIKLDALLQAIAPERPVVRLFKQQLVRRILETMESIRGGLDHWDNNDDLDGSSTLEDALSRVIDVPR
jgi:tetratricopeptide (TPR) repeat protein